MPRLHQAVYDNKLDEVKQFVEAGDDVNEVDKNYTPLLIASRHGHAAICEYLLSKGADVSFQRHTGTTSLMLASRFGHIHVCQILLEHGARGDTTNNDGDTAIIFAVRKNRVDVVRLLLEHETAKTMPAYSLYVKEKRQSIKDNLVGIRNDAELMSVVADKWKNLDDDVRALYITEANATHIATTGIRAASKKGYIDMVQLLIEHGADVNANDIYEATALILATQNNHADVVRLLLEKGAFTNYLDNKEQLTALDFACAGGYLDICNLLITHGANVHEFFCIQDACRHGHTEVVRLLIDNGANVDHGGSESYEPPICAASRDGYIEIVQLLIDNGADVNNVDVDFGYTALYRAAENGHIDICRLLIENEADVNISRPLEVAAEKGYTDICKLLIDNGAVSSPEYVSSAYENGHIQTCLFLIGDAPDALINAALNGWAVICVELRRRGMGGTWDAFEFRRLSDDVLNALKTQPTEKIVIEVKDMIALDSINASAEEKDNSPPCIIDEKEQWVMRLDTIIPYVRSGWNSPYGTPIQTVTLLSNVDITRINQDREQQRIEQLLYASNRRIQENEAYQEALRDLEEQQALARQRLRREMNPQESAYQDTLRVGQVRRRTLHVQIQSLRF